MQTSWNGADNEELSILGGGRERGEGHALYTVHLALLRSS